MSYSVKARYAAALAASGSETVMRSRGDIVLASFDAAHDREALGSDASACVRTLVEEIAERVRGLGVRRDDHGEVWDCDDFADYILREFGGRS